MNTATMLQTASVLLVLTALGGLLMAMVRFIGKKNPPSWIAMGHGFIAASGLTLLVYAGVNGRLEGAALTGLILLLLASTGGVALNLAYHLAGKLLPVWLLSLHIVLGLVGTVLVAVTAFGPQAAA